jgi:hypothetical protein
MLKAPITSIAPEQETILFEKYLHHPLVTIKLFIVRNVFQATSSLKIKFVCFKTFLCLI